MSSITITSTAPSVAQVEASESIVQVTVAQPTAGKVEAVGEQGPAGRSGDAASGPYIHEQTTPASIWTVVHNRGHRADITVYDIEDDQVICAIHHDSDNISTLTFSEPIAGIARAD